MPSLELPPSQLTPETLPRLCVPVAQSTTDALFAQSTALLPEFVFQELRLDALPDPSSALEALRAHVTAHPSATFLATCRRVDSGGGFTGSAEAELSILTRAAAAGCALVDLALESAESLGAEALRPLRSTKVTLVLSWHDFEGSGDPEAVLRRMRPFAPDVVKLVPTARRLTDNLPLLRWMESSSELPCRAVGVAMGEAGAASRVLGMRSGGAFTFAPATLAEATAPGQIAASVLRDLYRATELSRVTTVYGVAGSPVRSSLSPLMLNTAFRDRGVDAVYVPLLASDPADVIHFAHRLPLAGFSVTMPFKQAILPMLDVIDPLAARIGAVNTVRREADGTLTGFNTDAAGIAGPLQTRLTLRGARILVLGAGGAARAAAFACVGEGAEVSILNRTHASAVELADEAGAHALQSAELDVQPEFDVLIQATPAGMRHNATPLPLPEGVLPAALIFDLVYNPLDTPLLQAARRAGRAVVPGVEMFIHQGARQFELWTGQSAPVERMRQVVLEALGGRD